MSLTLCNDRAVFGQCVHSPQPRNIYVHLLWGWFLPRWKRKVQQGCRKSLAARHHVVCPKQSPDHLLLWHRNSPELALGCRRQREGCFPPPRCLQYCALRNRQALFQSSICCLELSPELYLFLFFHCFRRRQQTRVTMLRITTRAKLEMIEMITVMEYVGEKGGGGGGTCGVSPFGFLVPTGNDAVMQTKSEGYACARL